MKLEDVSLEDVVVAFDESNPNWTPNVEANILFVRGCLRHLFEVLSRRNHLFLNEAFDQLGFPRTREGVVLGWTEKSDMIAEIATFNHTNKVVIRFVPEGLIWDKI